MLPRGRSRVAIVEPVVVAQVVRHAVVAVRPKRLVSLPEPWCCQNEGQREEADHGPLTQTQANGIREIRPGHAWASHHRGRGLRDPRAIKSFQNWK